jgi:hypothetical protein
MNVIVTAVLGTVFGRWAQATDRRRVEYAAAVTTLFAWAEYPYRIRRRTSNEPAELARLANIGHDLQERLRCHQTWIITESPRVAMVYARVLKTVSGRAGPAAKDAWNSPPVIRPEQMNLNGWGPDDSVHEIEELERAIGARFGFWRILPHPRSRSELS